MAVVSGPGFPSALVCSGFLSLIQQSQMIRNGFDWTTAAEGNSFQCSMLVNGKLHHCGPQRGCPPEPEPLATVLTFDTPSTHSIVRGVGGIGSKEEG